MSGAMSGPMRGSMSGPMSGPKAIYFIFVVREFAAPFSFDHAVLRYSKTLPSQDFETQKIWI